LYSAKESEEARVVMYSGSITDAEVRTVFGLVVLIDLNRSMADCE